MSLFFSVLATVCNVYLVILVARMVVDWIQVFARDWRPRGIVLVVVEALYTVTDPPLRALRRLIPPLRLGSVALDVGFILLFLVVSFAGRLFTALSYTSV